MIDRSTSFGLERSGTDPVSSGSALFDTAFRTAKGSYAATVAVIAGTTAGLSPNEIDAHVTHVAAQEAASNSAGATAGKVIAGAIKGVSTAGTVGTATGAAITVATTAATLAASAGGSVAAAGSIIAVGAAIGNVIPIPLLGAAVGAAVGAIVALFSALFSGPPPEPPQAEFRSAREQHVFPAIKDTSAVSLGVNPGTWPWNWVLPWPGIPSATPTPVRSLPA